MKNGKAVGPDEIPVEIKKKSIDKAKQEERMSKDFAAMEEAALKAYQEDLKRMEREAQGLSSPVQAASQPQPVVTSKPKPQPKKLRKKEETVRRKAREQTETQVWVEGLTEDGHTYYYNTVTGESQWEQPEGFQGQSSTLEPSKQTESSSGCVWMEAVSSEGFTYYYNTETGESSWEKPADFPSNEESGSSSASNQEEQSQEEEPSAPLPEPLSGSEESSNGAPVSQEPEAAEQPKVPKITFRKRKAEPEPSEKEEDNKASEDAPKEDEDETKKEEEVQSSTAELEKTEERATPPNTQAKRPKAANPYGVWEQIQEEEDPYASVDLQLPQVEASTVSAPTDLPPEPKSKFKERIITSIGEEGGPASFRKNKTQNGKSRSLRQRDNDD
ncbi:WW domain-binding protein 4 isoform 2-T2 [Pholidichthys leucotaenia]